MACEQNFINKIIENQSLALAAPETKKSGYKVDY